MFSLPPIKLKPSRKAVRGRVVALFGAPGCGKSAVARVLQSASKKECLVVNNVEALEAAGTKCDVVFLDAVHSADDVQQLVELGYVDGVGPGRIVQVMIMGQKLPSATEEAWSKQRVAIEQAIHLYHLPYHTLQNVWRDLEAPVAELARIARLRS